MTTKVYVNRCLPREKQKMNKATFCLLVSTLLVLCISPKPEAQGQCASISIEPTGNGCVKALTGCVCILSGSGTISLEGPCGCSASISGTWSCTGNRVLPPVSVTISPGCNEEGGGGLLGANCPCTGQPVQLFELTCGPCTE